MGLVKTRRLAAMQKQQRAKAAMKPPLKGGGEKVDARGDAAACDKRAGVQKIAVLFFDRHGFTR